MPSSTTQRGPRLLQDSKPSSATSLPSPKSSRLRRVPTKTGFSALRHSSKIMTNLASHPYPTTLRYDQLHALLSCAHTYFQRLRNAIAFPFIHDGIPIVYYGMLYSPHGYLRCSWILGQEQGYAGGPDPANREACANLGRLGHQC